MHRVLLALLVTALAMSLRAADEPSFSHIRGCYDSSFTLIISSASGNVRYTTDCSWPSDTEGSGGSDSETHTISTTTVVKAVAYDVNGISKVVSHTYVFPAAVLTQPDRANGIPTSPATGIVMGRPDGWGSTAMKQNQGATVDDLKALPILSISLPMDEMFDCKRADGSDKADGEEPPGIGVMPYAPVWYSASSWMDDTLYENDTVSHEWERRTSIEIFLPNESDPAKRTLAASTCGIRMAGNMILDEDKKNMALEFRGVWGPGTLSADLMTWGAADEFDEIRLRHNGDGPENGQLTMAILERLRFAMGGHGPQTRHAHVYVNGAYWGIYDLTNRASEGNAAAWMGRDKDHVNYYRIHTRGRDTGWSNMFFNMKDVADEDDWELVTRVYDPVSYADYFIMSCVVGNTSGLGKEDRWVLNQQTESGWRFYNWDVGSDGFGYSRTDDAVTKDPTAGVGGTVLLYNNLMFIDHVADWAPWRRLLADRINRHLGPGGVFAAGRVEDFVDEAAGGKPDAYPAEIARWYDRTPVGREATDSAAKAAVAFKTWYPQRAAHLREVFSGAVVADGSTTLNHIDYDFVPTFSPHGGTFTSSTTVTISRPAGGVLFYTTDGSEPDGSPTATEVPGTSTTVGLSQTTLLKARIRYTDGTGAPTWGALTDAVYHGTEDRSQLRISEIHYHPFFDKDICTADAVSGRKEQVNGGLRVFRFDGTDTTARDTIKAIEVDDTIDFAWSDTASPHPELGSDGFSQMWEGWLVPRTTGEHKLVFEMEGERGFVNLVEFPELDENDKPLLGSYRLPVPIITITVAGSHTETTRALDLEAGKSYRIEVAYDRLGGPGHVRLKWIEPGETTATVIPYEVLRVDDTEPEDYAFIELHNDGDDAIDLSGWFFNQGITYTFPDYTVLRGGQRLVLAANPKALARRQPGVVVHGAYAGSLNDNGDHLVVCDADRTTVIDLTYGDTNGWPTAADGSGPSLVYIGGDPNDPTSWRASKDFDGTPGEDGDPAADGVIIVTEALTHTDSPQVDTIELHNPSTGTVDVSGWWLTDDRQTPQRWQIPAGTTIPAGGYLILAEDDDADPATTPSASYFGSAFSLSSIGEQIHLFAVDGTGTLTGYSHGFAFGAAANGVSFGRHVTSSGAEHFVAQKTNTLGAANAGPLVGPIVISEIMYNPAGTGDVEWIELGNVSAVAVTLYDAANGSPWTLGGTGYAFAVDATIPAGGVALVVSGDPAAFRSSHGIDAAVPIWGPFPGQLDNGGEALELRRPDNPEDVGGAVVVPMILVDRVTYDDADAWPTTPDGGGPSLERIAVRAYGDDVANWRASGADGGSPGTTDLGILRRLSIGYADGEGPLTTTVTVEQAGATFYQDTNETHTVDGLDAEADATVIAIEVPIGPG